MKYQSRKFIISCFVVILILSGVSIWISASLALNGTLEAESADTARWFLRLGDWSINHMNGAEDYDKPPLVYWIIGFFKLVTGANWELASRLPSLVSFLLIMFLFSIITGKPRPRNLIMLSGAILATSPKVLFMSYTARVDLSFAFCTFSSIVFFNRYLEEYASGKWRLWYYLFYIFAALAVMIKGPVGFIIIGGSVFIFMFYRGTFKELRMIFLGPGMLLFLALAVPWFVVASFKTNGNFFLQFILEENLSRFGNIFHVLQFTDFKSRPFWLYLPYFLAGFFPWFFFVPSAIFHILKNKWRKSGYDSLLLIYFIWTFLFFSLAGMKRNDYLLPIYPAAVLFVAEYLWNTISFIAFRRFFLAIGLCYILITLISLALTFPAVNEWLTTQYPSLAALKRGLPPDLLNSLFPYLLFLLIILAGVWVYGWFGREREKIAAACLITQAVMLFFVICFVLRPIDVNKDTRPYIAEMNKIIGNRQVHCFPSWDEEYGFYLDRVIKTMDQTTLIEWLKGNGEKGFLLIPPKDFNRLFDYQSSVPFLFKENMPSERPMYLIANFCEEGMPGTKCHHVK
jgi:4-amino-4-deoxy-L-arabinose transferase-like glycosyltransferase